MFQIRFAVLVLAMLSIGIRMGAAADARPNVLFILSDDLRPDLGCYGHPMVQSPNIDALAKTGVRFERTYVQFPLCNPSRSSMLTGRYPTTTGVLDNLRWFGGAHPEFVSLPKYFKQNGYAVLRTGKVFHGGIDDDDSWTIGGETRKFAGAVNDMPRPTQQQRKDNSDRMVVLDGNGEKHGDHKTADRAIELLRQHKDGRFFLCCGFTKPHSPPSAPQKFYDLYDPAKIPLPPDFASRPTTPAGFPANSVPKSGDLFIERDASPEDARKMIQAYWASASWMDWNVGRVIAELDRLKLREKTIIVFWGDHGYHLGEKGKWSKHNSLFEIGTRVPLLICVPGSAVAGQSSPRIVESIDIYPTLAELCGLPTPSGVEGASLQSLLQNPQATWTRPAITVTGQGDKVSGVAVRTEKLRYIRFAGRDDVLLFDETADPHEMTNIAADPRFAAERDSLAKIAAPFLNKP